MVHQSVGETHWGEVTVNSSLSNRNDTGDNERKPIDKSDATTEWKITGV